MKAVHLFLVTFVFDVASAFVPSLIGSQGRSSLQAENAESGSEFNQLKITFVTGNEMKAREMNMILNDHGATKGPCPDTSLVKLRLLDVDLPEIQEVSTHAIAKNKAIQAAQLSNGPCVVEDTSLEFEALGGMPGEIIFYQFSSSFYFALLISNIVVIRALY